MGNSRRAAARLSSLISSTLLIGCTDPGAPLSTLGGVMAYSEPSGIHVLDLSSGRDQTIYTVEVGEAVWGLTWEPDGESLVFQTYAFGPETKFTQQWKMYTISADGSDHGLVLDRAGPETYPAYGPDGRLAYWGLDGTRAALFVNGSPVLHMNHNESRPAWTPDGSTIFAPEGPYLVRIPLSDTSAAAPAFTLTDLWDEIFDPDCSPDGSRIAFSWRVGITGGEIWLIDVDGDNPLRLTTGHLDTEPAWSPDGTTIAFVRDGEGIYSVDVELGEQVLEILTGPVTHLARTP